jgi:uncharacterized membrane protein
MDDTKKQKMLTISKFTLWRILVYFVIYSFLGFIIETMYGMITKGVIESRQSFLYGPFCGIYGLGAVTMILSLNKFKDNNNQLFFGGFIVGSIIEYIVSFLGEIILHVKWWDYSDMPFNLNGRICVFFSVFWGFLAIYLISYVNPKIDYLINKISAKLSMKVLRFVTVFSIIFLLFDCMITIFALDMFFTRKVYENNLNVANRELIDIQYEEIYKNAKKAKFINKFFYDKKMIKTFPNLKLEDLEGNIIYFKDYVGDIKPYYYKFKAPLGGKIIDVGENLINSIKK